MAYDLTRRCRHRAMIVAVLMMAICLGCAPEGPPPGFRLVETHHGPMYERIIRPVCVVYVIDRSGSMHKVFGLVRSNLYSAIGNLTEKDRFHVILLAADEPLEKEPRELTLATDENKGAAGDLLAGVTAQGPTDPLPALRRAFEVLDDASPEEGKLIHLLSDGFPDNDAVLSMIAELNTDGDVQINTYAVGDDPLNRAVMEQIADQNSGAYKYVPAEDLW